MLVVVMIYGSDGLKQESEMSMQYSYEGAVVVL